MTTDVAQRVQRMTRLAAEAERMETLARWRLARCEEAASAARAAAVLCRDEAQVIPPEPEGTMDRLLWALHASRARARSAQRAAHYERLHERLAQRAERRRADLRAAAQARASCERRLETLAHSIKEHEQNRVRREAEERLISRAPDGVRL